MFHFSWGETFVVIGAGFFIIGRKDLPRAAKVVGTQVGRIVGLLQGARARADRFAGKNELTQLQNELRSGLRELDTIRSEMAVAVSSQGVVGRTLGATVPAVNNRKPIMNNLKASAVPMEDVSKLSHTEDDDSSIARNLAPRSQAVAAVAEDEWQKQGIGFQSIGEKGGNEDTGSGILSNLFKQTLIYDQHDRVVQEQDSALRSRIREKNRT